jgi:hypothetical protein
VLVHPHIYIHILTSPWTLTLLVQRLIYIYIYIYIRVYICIYEYVYIHAGSRSDLYRLSATSNAWTALFPSGSGPSERRGMGFAATPDGMLYVFGGLSRDGGGNEGKGARQLIRYVCIYNMMYT